METTSTLAMPPQCVEMLPQGRRSGSLLPGGRGGLRAQQSRTRRRGRSIPLYADTALQQLATGAAAGPVCFSFCRQTGCVVMRTQACWLLGQTCEALQRLLAGLAASCQTACKPASRFPGSSLQWQGSRVLTIGRSKSLGSGHNILLLCHTWYQSGSKPQSEQLNIAGIV